MHSLKNTIVAILLLGVSYGVYEVITAPQSEDSADQSLIEPLDIDEGLVNSPPSDADGPKPHVQLPEVAPNPANSTRLPSNPIGEPAVLPKSQSTVTLPPTVSPESVVNRQAKTGVFNHSNGEEQPTIAESTLAAAELPKDHELIAALKEQLESEDELDGLDSEFGLEPKGELVSTTAKPDAARVALSETNPDSNSFAPAASPVKIELAQAAPSDQQSALWADVEKLTDNGEFREALKKLTPYFADPSFAGAQKQKLLKWLDALASKVIYSAEHNFSGQPYVVQPNESIEDIANRWNVTAQLIYNINQPPITNPPDILPGTELKMVNGPFHAEVDLTEKTMTVFVENLYAGRFAIEVESDSDIPLGQFGVSQKTINGPAPNGHTGTHIITLENGVCIHAVSPQMDSEHRSCIRLAKKDAADSFAIFTEKSKFIFKR